MLLKLEDNQRTLKIRNKKLKENLNKMKSIEKLILELETAGDITSVVRKIMKSFVSEMDLGFMRGMFFRYSREKDAFVGEMCVLNSHITEIRNDILKERKTGFNFQIKQLEDVVKLIKIPYSEENFIANSLIKIPYSEENFIANSFRNRQSIYINDKGYKHNLGNDLFNTIGLKNFVAVPIYNIDYYSGVMLFDYYTKSKEITEEDIELIKILMMNVTTKLKNRVDETERIETERNRTINNITERFLTTREEALNRLVTLVQENKSDNLKTERFLTTREEALNRLVTLVQENKSDNLKEIEDEIRDFKEKVKNIKYSNKILKQYSNPSDRKKLEPVNIEHFMVEMIGEFRNILKEDGNEDKVTIASFISYTEDVLGNRERFKRAFMELLKNAYDAVMASDRRDGNEDKVTIASFISYTEDVLGNRERFKRAFMELLKNAYDAVMASDRSDKKITIIVIRDKIANKIKIDIKDNGIGMDEEQLKYIFQPFMTYKGDTPGLGVPLAERVIKDCKGVIKFYSTLNQGTEIKITLNIFKEEQ